MSMQIEVRSSLTGNLLETKPMTSTRMLSSLRGLSPEIVTVLVTQNSSLVSQLVWS